MLVLGIFLAGFLARTYVPPLTGDSASQPAPSLTPPLRLAASTHFNPTSNPSDPCSHSNTSEDRPRLPAMYQVVMCQARQVNVTVRMLGQIGFDPARVFEVVATFPARVDRLFVTSPGLRVKAGEPLLQVFFPDAVEAQAELIAALVAQQEAGGTGGFLGRLKTRNMEDARQALRRMGLTPEQVQEVERDKRPSESLLFRAPLTGHLIDVQARTGHFAQRGDLLCTVADLSVVHAILSATQSDLAWLRYGQRVRLTVHGREEETLGGRIAAIGVAAGNVGRGWDVHVQVDNGLDLLRPGMAVDAMMTCRTLGPGLVTDPNLAGRWLCPVHPDQVSEQAGECGVCARALVSAASLGYVEPAPDMSLPLVIPAAAVYDRAGETAVTVQEGDATYRTKIVALGGTVGSYRVVLDGLHENEQVVVPTGDAKPDSP